MKRKPTFSLPKGHWPSAVVNDSPDDFEWVSSEKLLADAERRRRNWLAKMQSLLLRYQREDDALRRKRAAEIAREVAADREKQEREDRRDNVKDRDYWLREREKDGPLMAKLVERYQQIVDDSPFRREMLAKLAELAELDKQLNRVAARAERNALLRRGVVRGRRKV
jgi:hypothetical protein